VAFLRLGIFRAVRSTAVSRRARAGVALSYSYIHPKFYILPPSYLAPHIQEMPVTTRSKRKADDAPAAEPAALPSTKRSRKPKAEKDGAEADKKEEVQKEKAATNGAATGEETAVPSVGDVINLDGFGGEIELNDGAKTTLKELVDKSKSGVVIFTYPKASTPGCKSPFSPSP